MSRISDIKRHSVAYTRRYAGKMYHGSAERFEVFRAPVVSPEHPFGVGIWLAEDVMVAAGFADRVAQLSGRNAGFVMEVDVPMTELLVFDGFLSFLDTWSSMGVECFKGSLLAKGLGGLVINNCETDGMPARSDFCLLDEAALRVVSVTPFSF